jgi:anti-sigma factor RsiW
MRKCNDYLDELNDYLDGDLDPSLCLELEKHIGECKNCKLMVDSLRMTVKLCREGGECEELPADLADRMNSMLRWRWDQKFGQTR